MAGAYKKLPHDDDGKPIETPDHTNKLWAVIGGVLVLAMVLALRSANSPESAATTPVTPHLGHHHRPKAHIIHSSSETAKISDAEGPAEGPCPGADCPRRSVLVMRHCARSTPLSTSNGAKGFYEFDNYTSKQHQPFPSWTVGTYECLPRGNELIRQFSGNISLTFPRPVQVVADSCCNRDRDTADDFIIGARLDPGTTDYRTNTVVFGSMDQFPGFYPPYGACRGDVANQAKNADITANFNTVKKPDGLEKMLASLQDNVLGKGDAPPLPDIPTGLLSTPPTQLGPSTVLVGGVPIAAAFVEAFLMQEGGGYPVAWNTLPPKELNDLLAINIYNRAIGDSRAKGWARVSHASMLASIVQFLTNDNPNDKQDALTKVFVGHDSDLDSLATLLDLTWNAAPYPTNSTTPGSVLRFDLDGDSMVTMSYQYTSFGLGIDGAAHTVPVFRPQADGTQGVAYMGLSDLAHLSTEVYNEDCIVSPLP